jgi:hypothetical protein
MSMLLSLAKVAPEVLIAIRTQPDLAGADNSIRAGHAACSYSWMRPPKVVAPANREVRDGVWIADRLGQGCLA